MLNWEYLICTHDIIINTENTRQNNSSILELEISHKNYFKPKRLKSVLKFNCKIIE